jgi:hypothetical protein
MMPSKTKKQADFMRAVAHSPTFAKRVGVPTSVGREFSEADKGRFSRGGEMKSKPMMMDKMMKKAPKKMMGGGMTYAKGGLTAGHKAADGIAKKGKTKGMQVKMAGGGKC